MAAEEVTKPAAPAATAKATPAAAATAVAPAAAPAVVEKQTNCLGCNKALKKIKRYYRNGKYYCTKRCWQKAIAPKEEKK